MNNTRKIDIFWINLIAIAIYFVVFMGLNTVVNDKIMFSTPDSRSYLAVADWLQGKADINPVLIRPFLYPAIILLLHKTFGAYGLWCVQLFCWLGAINLTFAAIQRTTQCRILSYIGALAVVSNFSFIALTLHALTEVATTFLLSLLVYVVASNSGKRLRPSFFHECLLILVLLSAVKPLFNPLVILMLLFVFPAFYLKKHLQSPKSFIVLLLILSPLILQFGLMKIKPKALPQGPASPMAQTPAGSLPYVFNQYLFSEGMWTAENIDISDRQQLALVRQRAQGFSPEEQLKYVLEHKRIYLACFLKNIANQYSLDSFIIVFPRHADWLLKYTTIMNHVYYRLHIVFAFLSLLSIYLLWKEKNLDFAFVEFTALFLTYYIHLASGLSFWQADRLVLPSIVVCAFLYVVVFYQLLNCIALKFINRAAAAR